MDSHASVRVFFCCLWQSNSWDDLIEGLRMEIYLRARREDEEEIVEMVCDIPSIEGFEYPVESFWEEVEYSLSSI